MLITTFHFVSSPGCCWPMQSAQGSPGVWLLHLKYYIDRNINCSDTIPVASPPEPHSGNGMRNLRFSGIYLGHNGYVIV